METASLSSSPHIHNLFNIYTTLSSYGQPTPRLHSLTSSTLSPTLYTVRQPLHIFHPTQTQPYTLYTVRPLSTKHSLLLCQHPTLHIAPVYTPYTSFHSLHTDPPILYKVSPLFAVSHSLHSLKYSTQTHILYVAFPMLTRRPIHYKFSALFTASRSLLIVSSTLYPIW
jgi:hypothetical protein